MIEVSTSTLGNDRYVQVRDVVLKQEV